jgi:DNA-damage-inducible protein D
MTETNLELRGSRVGEDEHGNICLNDLWKLAASPANRQPKDWYSSKRVAAVKRVLDQRMEENSHHSEDRPTPPTYAIVGKGRGARTYAHAVLALDYATYLEPQLAVEVNEVFLRFRANDLTLALEILDGLTAQPEFDQTRVELRRLLADHNKLSAAAAKDAGVKDFAAYNGSGLKGLYGGRTKAQVLEHKGLPSDAHHLDHAGHEELAANYFKATQAEAKLKRDAIKGQVAANAAHEAVGKVVRKTIAEIGGTMPEDEPALEHVDKAKRRLKSAAPNELPKK